MIRLFFTVAASLSLVASSLAADLPGQRPPAAGTDDWTFTIAPYFWAAGMSGDVGQFDLPAVHVDASFSDILDNLDFAVMATGEARNGRFSLFGDVLYVKLSSDVTTPRGVYADSVDVGSETFAGLAGVGYAVWQGPQGHLDVVGGLRAWHVSTDISFTGQVLDGRHGRDSANWVDGLAGLRGRYAFSEKVYLTGWGLVGAGGADLDWDVGAGVGYTFNDRVSLVVGYRALGVDYSRDGFVFDVVEQGPIIGTVINF
ncbi:hypothetical protein J2X65_000519 [Ancylobacter sp. 3268]|uniref:hypothetical protein n=1 Tax=Ancylobacter sp. 3268 TaxID=2817752 RepID=UPI00285704BF|nr:hypothetical protein [Ancylobacter sp. 3268]MDR6951171.1 hypothetical protein [Ancylobacter sp. 3268]